MGIGMSIALFTSTPTTTTTRSGGPRGDGAR
jgi:hypothetical protein